MGWLVYFWLVASNVQTVLSIDVGGVAVKLFHFITLVLLFFLLIRKKVPAVKNSLFWLALSVLLFFIIHSVIAYGFYGFNGLILNYILSLMCLFLGFLVINEFEFPLKALQNMALILFSIILLKDIFFIREIVSFLSAPYGHPIIWYLYGGGPNLEATWCGMFLAFFLKEKIFYPLAVFALVISFMYASRVGFIVVFGVVFAKAIFSYGALRVIVFSMAGLVAIVATFMYGDFYLVERFASVGNDPGSVGRLNLWSDSINSVLGNPFGYGAGNAVGSLLYGDYIEDNVHNYVLQVLMDFGVVGVVAWLLFYFKLITLSFRKPEYAEYFIFFSMFFVASMIQFRGGEVMFWIVVGVFSGLLEREIVNDSTGSVDPRL